MEKAAEGTPSAAFSLLERGVPYTDRFSREPRGW